MDPEQLNIDYLKEDLSVYRRIEHWGLTLLVAGIGGITYQLVQWLTDADHKLNAPTSVVFVPIIMGIFGMVFLRIVNYRLEGVRSKLRELMRDRNPRTKWLGWSMALFPLGAGFGGTCFVTWAKCPENSCSYFIPLNAITYFIIAIIALIITAILYSCISKKHE